MVISIFNVKSRFHCSKFKSFYQFNVYGLHLFVKLISSRFLCILIFSILWDNDITYLHNLDIYSPCFNNIRPTSIFFAKSRYFFKTVLFLMTHPIHKSIFILEKINNKVLTQLSCKLTFLFFLFSKQHKKYLFLMSLN